MSKDTQIPVNPLAEQDIKYQDTTMTKDQKNNEMLKSWQDTIASGKKHPTHEHDGTRIPPAGFPGRDRF